MDDWLLHSLADDTYTPRDITGLKQWEINCAPDCQEETGDAEREERGGKEGEGGVFTLCQEQKKNIILPTCVRVRMGALFGFNFREISLTRLESFIKSQSGRVLSVLAPA